MFTVLILVLECARLAFELRNGVPKAGADRVILLVGVALVALTICEAIT